MAARKLSLIVLLALAACRRGETPPSTGDRPLTPGWQGSRTLGVQVAAPADATVRELGNGAAAHVGNGTFKLNLFVVDQYSAQSAEEQKTLIETEPGFAKLTRADMGDNTWRFDYELGTGKSATIARVVAGRAFDCGVYSVTQEIATQVASACASAKKL